MGTVVTGGAGSQRTGSVAAGAFAGTARVGRNTVVIASPAASIWERSASLFAAVVETVPGAIFSSESLELCPSSAAGVGGGVGEIGRAHV